jgi:hypothetical protein
MIKENVLRKNLLTNEIDYGNVDSEFEAENLNGNIVQNNPWIEIRENSDEYKANNLSCIKSQKIQSIKIEASKRINDLYPQYKQLNNMAAVTEILNRENYSVKQGKIYELTEEDKIVLKKAKACKQYIEFIRVKSNILEEYINSIVDYNILENINVSEDQYWI